VVFFHALSGGWMSLAAITENLKEVVGDGFNCTSFFAYAAWSGRAASFLRHAFDEETARRFNGLSGDPDTWQFQVGQQIGILEGIAAFGDDGTARVGSVEAASPSRAAVPISKKVFAAHGHDHGAKETVARYLERLGLEAVILHEKPSESRTVIEKIEAFSDVGFAVVLLTPDDVGAAKAEAANLRPRARQNVVLEQGYFLGKLRRSRVCALYTPGVEIPSDYQGVLYIELDSKGAWRSLLAQELSNARLPINVAGLLGS